MRENIYNVPPETVTYILPSCHSQRRAETRQNGTFQTGRSNEVGLHTLCISFHGEPHLPATNAHIVIKRTYANGAESRLTLSIQSSAQHFPSHHLLSCLSEAI